MIVGALTATPPPLVPIRVTELGKPLIVGSSIRFNVSHAGDCCMIALAADAHVGVDIEPVRPLPAMNSITRVIMSEAERKKLALTPEPDHTRLFYDLWTGKEAFLKCLGIGLRCDLRRVPSLTFKHDVKWPGSRLSFRYLPVDAPVGYSAALAIGIPPHEHAC